MHVNMFTEVIATLVFPSRPEYASSFSLLSSLSPAFLSCVHHAPFPGFPPCSCSDFSVHPIRQELSSVPSG